MYFAQNILLRHLKSWSVSNFGNLLVGVVHILLNSFDC